MRVKAGLAIAVVAGGLIVVLGIGMSLPGGEVRSSEWGSVPRLLIGFGFVAVAVLQVLLVRVGLLSGPRVERWTLVSSALLACALGAGHVLAAREIERLHEDTTIFVRTGGGLVESVPYATANAAFVQAAGWVMLACAAAVALLPIRRPWVRRGYDAREVLSAAPWLVGLVVFLLADPARVPVEQVIDAKWSQSLQAASGFALVNVLMALALALSLVFLWQAMAAARAAHDLGVGLVRLSGRLPSVLLALLALKGTWVALGYVGELPAFLGGETGMWDDSRADGWLAWAIAGCLAAVVAYALTASLGLTAPPTQDLRRAQSWLAGGFMAPWIAAALAALLALTFALWSPLADQFGALSLWLAEQGIWAGAITVFIALVVGLVGLSRGRLSEWWMVGLFLIAFAIWAGPRALSIAIDRRDPPTRGSVELVTLDTAITVALAVLAFGLWLRRRGGDDAILRSDVLLLVLGASTFACYAGFLFAASPSDVKGIAFSIGLVFPALYLFFGDSQALNHDRPGRERLLLAVVALVGALLLLAVFQIGTGVLDENTDTFGKVGQIVFVVPVVSLFVLAAIARMQGATEARAAP